MEASESPRCPLCRSAGVRPLAPAHGRSYRECGVCGLVHVPPEHRLGPAEELAHYGTHENDPEDPGYRAFLDRLAAPLALRLPAGAEGLDFGSGPGPALSRMMRERGFSMEQYDPFFAPDADALRRTYDFVACTETAEHFFHPAEEFERLDRLLRPGGWLGVMTELLREDRALEGWRYARDPTHVCFYRPRTMHWIAERFGWSVELPHPNVALFQKPTYGAAAP
jgi:SAM-dependent methyltransferase